MYLSIVKSSAIIYSHIRHSSPIATLFYSLLPVFPSLDFSLVRGQVKDNNACNQIKGYGGDNAKNPLFARLSEDFIKQPQRLMNRYEIVWFKSRFVEEI